MAVILLFDDIDYNRDQISAGLRAELDNDCEVNLFLGDVDVPSDQSYETCIEEQLCNNNLAGRIGLIACDKELGQFDKYRGLSANAISVVARNLGIPFCQYSRNFNSERQLERFQRLRRWNSEDITLDGEDVDEWVEEIAALYRGFNAIAVHYEQHPESKQLKPAKALATIMGKPDAATRIALYGSGDQSVLPEIFAFVSDDPIAGRTIDKRMPRILGTWLLLSLLRFPGLLVNHVAASSLLNVALEDFAKEDVMTVFEAAKYKGPFSDLHQWWWREKLEEMILDGEAEDGRDLLRRRGTEVDECLDKNGDRTGYYCMISEQPVSRKNSVGDINWFPSGADLSRIENDKFDEITSLVSM